MQNSSSSRNNNNMEIKTMFTMLEYYRNNQVPRERGILIRDKRIRKDNILKVMFQTNHDWFNKQFKDYSLESAI